jgi:hypothetical protein
MFTNHTPQYGGMSEKMALHINGCFIGHLTNNRAANSPRQQMLWEWLCSLPLHNSEATPSIFRAAVQVGSLPTDTQREAGSLAGRIGLFLGNIRPYKLIAELDTASMDAVSVVVYRDLGQGSQSILPNVAVREMD